MASNRPITYEMMVEHFASHHGRVRWNTRTNTHVEPGDTLDYFDVFLYGSKIATVFSNGSVRLNRRGWTSTTTRNRMNDVLLPLGWKITAKQDRWYVQTVEAPYRSMEYIDDMILTRISKEA